jgi:hypothetical protein
MKLADVGKSWLATRMGIVTETLRRMTIDKIRGIDRQEKELQEDQAKLDAQYKVRCRDMGSLHEHLPSASAGRRAVEYAQDPAGAHEPCSAQSLWLRCLCLMMKDFPSAVAVSCLAHPTCRRSTPRWSQRSHPLT